MWKKPSDIDVTASSIFDLKAELLKKKELFRQEKAANDGIKKGGVRLSKTVVANKGVNLRAQKDLLDIVEAPTLASSRAALERKSKLYERLKAGDIDPEDLEKNEEVLVDFDRKYIEEKEFKESNSKRRRRRRDPSRSDSDEDSSNNAKAGDDPWVEHVDEFGRTRVIRTSQLRKMQAEEARRSRSPGEDNEPAGPLPGGYHAMPPPEEYAREEEINRNYDERMRREIEAQEEMDRIQERLKKEQTSFYDAKKDNRTMGVGFYQFSSDQEERQRQMSELKGMRDQTLANRDTVQTVKSARQKKMDERLAKVMERKKKSRGELGKDHTSSSSTLTVVSNVEDEGAIPGNSVKDGATDFFVEDRKGTREKPVEEKPKCDFIFESDDMKKKERMAESDTKSALEDRERGKAVEAQAEEFLRSIFSQASSATMESARPSAKAPENPSSKTHVQYVKVEPKKRKRWDEAGPA